MNNLEKIKYYSKQLLFIFVSFCFALAAIEGLLQLKNRGGIQDNIYVIQDNGLRKLIPNINKYIAGGDGILMHFVTNNEGFSSDEHSLLAATNTKRIVFLGNSFTQGTDIDYEKKMTNIVKKLYQKTDLGQEVEIMNFAIGGYSIAEQLILYREYVRKYKPDVVILVSYVGYDLSTNVRFLPQRDIILQKDFNDLTSNVLLQAENEYVEKNRTIKNILIEKFEIPRYLIKAVRSNKILYEIAIKVGLLNRPFTKETASYLNDVWAYMNPDSEMHKEVIDYTADIIARFNRLVLDDGASFSLVIIPSYWQVNNKYIEQLRTKNIPMDVMLPNKIIKQRTQEKFPILDLSDRIGQAINEENIPIFLNDIGHFTEKGNIIAAEEIADFIEDNTKVLGL